jgi:hypothetical protein
MEGPFKPPFSSRERGFIASILALNPTTHPAIIVGITIIIFVLPGGRPVKRIATAVFLIAWVPLVWTPIAVFAHDLWVEKTPEGLTLYNQSQF